MKHKLIALGLAFAMALGMNGAALAAEVQTHQVPVTLTVVNAERKLSVTVPASLPVSVVDGTVVTATNAAITNHAQSGAIRVTAVNVEPGAFTVGSFDTFSAKGDSIALSINGCSTRSAGPVDLTGEGFPVIQAGQSLAIRYNAKVAAVREVSAVTAATVIFTVAAAD